MSMRKYQIGNVQSAAGDLQIMVAVKVFFSDPAGSKLWACHCCTRCMGMGTGCATKRLACRIALNGAVVYHGLCVDVAFRQFPIPS